MENIGITAFGGYVPRMRLSRESIVQANSWVNPALTAYSKSERAICDIDEDSVTMAVEAVRDCLNGTDRSSIEALYFATTTAPFDCRQNSSIIAEAVGLKEDITTLDLSNSQRAGTSGLIAALGVLSGNEGAKILHVASDHRQTKSATVQELLFGDGAAALSLGGDNVVARFLGSHSINRDFVDHFRGQGTRFDYDWEQRWVREEGYFKILPEAITALLNKTGVATSDIDHFVLPCIIRGVREKVAKAMGIPAKAVRDNLQAGCGETGTAHPLVMLVDALQDAAAGQKILVAGFGQGADVLLFETTDQLDKLSDCRGIKGSIAGGIIEKNYQKYLSFREMVEVGWGIQAEMWAKRVRMTQAYRDRKMLTGFVGGKCTACGTIQYPPAHICVNPDCRAINSMDDYPLADVPATIASFTIDLLAFSPNPPLIFGMIEFENGAKLMMQMSGFDPAAVKVGAPVEVVFRIKDIDKERNFRNYYWKAAPRSAIT